MAQLGDLPRARELLRRAARAFGTKEPVARAKCVVAEAEVALASRDLVWSRKALGAARAVLEKHGDLLNAAHARYLEIRQFLLMGRQGEAEHLLAGLDVSRLPPMLRTVHELVIAGIALRSIRAKDAGAALARAESAARQAGIPALRAEAEIASAALKTPAARLITRREERILRLEEVESLLASKAFIVDACRRAVRCGNTIVSFAKRPTLFALARTLGEAWPGDAPRELLLARAFGARLADESHRARLRVEVGRLRRALRDLADLAATKRGFALVPRRARRVAVLAPPVDGERGAVLAFLADGESWSSSALALALGTSQRTVRRALDALAGEGKVRSLGRARSRRWLGPAVPGFTTALLLPGPMPSD